VSTEEPKFDPKVIDGARKAPPPAVAPTGMEQWLLDIAREIRASMNSGDHWDQLSENERVPWLHFADRVTKGLIRRGYPIEAGIEQRSQNRRRANRWPMPGPDSGADAG
jgi:hypothetical protein